MEGSGAIALGLLIATADLALYDRAERRKAKGGADA
jgi:hypothetical protein